MASDGREREDGEFSYLPIVERGESRKLVTELEEWQEDSMMLSPSNRDVVELVDQNDTREAVRGEY